MKRLIFLFLFLSTTVFAQYSPYIGYVYGQWSFGAGHPSGALYIGTPATNQDFGIVFPSSSGGWIPDQGFLAFRAYTPTGYTPATPQTYTWSVLNQGAVVASGVCTTAAPASGAIFNGTYASVVLKYTFTDGKYLVNGVDFGYGSTLAVTIIVNGVRYDINGGSSPVDTRDVNVNYTFNNHSLDPVTVTLSGGGLSTPFTLPPLTESSGTVSFTGVQVGTVFSFDPQPFGLTPDDPIIVTPAAGLQTFDRTGYFGTMPTAQKLKIVIVNYSTEAVGVHALYSGIDMGTLTTLASPSAGEGAVSDFSIEVDLPTGGTWSFTAPGHLVGYRLQPVLLDDGTLSPDFLTVICTVDKPATLPDPTFVAPTSTDNPATVIVPNDTTGDGTADNNSVVDIPSFDSTKTSIVGGTGNPTGTTGGGSAIDGAGLGLLKEIRDNTATPKFADGNFQDAVSLVASHTSALATKVGEAASASVAKAAETHDAGAIESTVSAPMSASRIYDLIRPAPRDIDWDYAILEPLWTVDCSAVSLPGFHIGPGNKINLNPMQFLVIRGFALALRSIILFVLVSYLLRKLLHYVAWIALTSTSGSPPPHTAANVSVQGGFRGAVAGFGADLGLLWAWGWRAMFTLFILSVPVLFFGFLSSSFGDFVDVYVAFDLANSLNNGGGNLGFTTAIKVAFTFVNYWIPVTFMIFTAVYETCVLSTSWAAGLVKFWVLRLFPA